MTVYRCAVNIYGYCKGVPKVVEDVNFNKNPKCKPDDCGDFLKWSDIKYPEKIGGKTSVKEVKVEEPEPVQVIVPTSTIESPVVKGSEDEVPEGRLC